MGNRLSYFSNLCNCSGLIHRDQSAKVQGMFQSAISDSDEDIFLRQSIQNPA